MSNAAAASHDEEGIELAGYEGAKMAMWLFLATEVLIFGGLFAAYVYFRSFEPDKFNAGSKSLYWYWGATNTVVLLVSSLTAALALDSIQRGNLKKMKTYLWVTIGCALIFMVIKYIEYSAKCNIGLCPVLFETPVGTSETVTMGMDKYGKFIPLYFLMTGLHGLHVLIGVACMVGVLLYARRKDKPISDYYYVPMENTALYWHLVDLVWIFLFPLLYLIG